MHQTSALIGALALGACCAPSESITPHREAATANDTAAADEAKGTDMARTEILITTDEADLRAQLVDNDATRALAKMLPLRIEMRDHLRQEKTGELPSPLPESDRQTDFSVGTLGLWEDRDFVIYYDEGRVPAPGIVILGKVSGDLSQFDNPDNVTVFLQATD
jgi:hypothetical protein